MTDSADRSAAEAEESSGNPRVALLLSMATFVLVVDTSIMNVSISAVASDLGTSVSSVQSAIALEALVSAAFILINSKLGDIVGRRRAFVLGLLGYALGALAMTLTDSVIIVVFFWSVLGGFGASLLMPAMQSLIHGNFTGRAREKTYAMVGAAAAVGAAIGPLLGGFVTTYLSWRIGFLIELMVIAVVLVKIRLIADVPFSGSRKIDFVGAVLSVLGMGGVVLGILVWQEGGEYVGLLTGIGAVGLAALAWWLVRRTRAGDTALLDPELFTIPNFRVGTLSMMMQQITLGGAMIALPLFLQVSLEYDAMRTGLSLAPLSLTMFVVALAAGKIENRRAASIIRLGFGFALIGMILVIPVIPRGASGWSLLVPLLFAGIGLGLLVSRLNNYILGPIDDERVSEAAGVNSAGQSFGLSFGLALAGGILLATLSFGLVSMTEASDVIPVADQRRITRALEDSAQLVSTTRLEQLLADQPDEIAAEIIRINSDAGILSLQLAMIIPVTASLLGFLTTFRMMKLPDFNPSRRTEGFIGG